MSTRVWDPKLHPRNENGEWVAKRGGSFLYGKTREARHGGIHYHLGPGDIAYAARGAVRVRKPDGTTAEYGGRIPAGAPVRLLDQQRAVEVVAKDLSEAERARQAQVRVGDVVTLGQLAFLPIGSVINAGGVSGIVKTAEGWKLPGTGAVVKVWRTDVRVTVTRLGSA